MKYLVLVLTVVSVIACSEQEERLLKPVESQFKNVTVVEEGDEVFLDIEDYGQLPQSLVLNDPEDYLLKREFYALVVPGSLYSGDHEDDRFFLTNISKTRPYLEKIPGLKSLINCGTGGSKPPKDSGTRRSRMKSLSNCSSGSSKPPKKPETRNAGFSKELDQVMELENLSHWTLVTSDDGLYQIGLSDYPISEWDRITMAEIDYASQYDVEYVRVVGEDLDYVWSLDY